MYKGIDVSVHNGKVDWEKVSGDGIRFAILRAGYGNDITQKDGTFEYNYEQSKKYGIKLGAYWFSYSVNSKDALREAKVFRDCLKGKQFELPVFFDYEYDSVRYAKELGYKVDVNTVNSIALTFIRDMNKNGWYCGNYTNVDYHNRYFSKSKELQKFPLWVAEWGVSTPSISNWSIWQDSDSGKVNGITTKVDTNKSLKCDYLPYFKEKGLNGFTKSKYRSTVQSRFNLSDGTMKYLDGHPTPDALYRKLATKG